MSRANPFNKDTKALEDNLHWRKADVDQAYEAGYYLRWAITKLHYVSLETLPWMFYNYQNRKVRVQQLSNFGSILSPPPVFFMTPSYKLYVVI